jgi:hypothetical protein
MSPAYVSIGKYTFDLTKVVGFYVQAHETFGFIFVVDTGTREHEFPFDKRDEAVEVLKLARKKLTDLGHDIVVLEP